MIKATAIWATAIFSAATCSAAGWVGASPAWATEGEREWSAAALAGSDLSAGADGQLLWHYSDFWAFGAGVRARATRNGVVSGGPQILARWTLDALRWIPSLAVGAGVSAESAEKRVWPLVTGEASLTYRPARAWGLSVRAQVEAPAVDGNAGTRYLIGVGYVGYFGQGIGVDL